MKKVISVFLILVCIVCFSACNFGIEEFYESKKIERGQEEIREYTVKFFGNGGTLISGDDEQTVQEGYMPTIPSFYRAGYTLVGFDKEVVYATKDEIYTAVWEIAEYSLILHLSENSYIDDANYILLDGKTYKRTFTFWDEFLYPTPTTENGCEFYSWKDFNGEEVNGVELNTESNLEIFMFSNEDYVSMSFSVDDGTFVQGYFSESGEKIYAPKVIDKEKTGYGINWYQDEEYSTLYTFDVMPEEDLTVYGKWEKESGPCFYGFDVENEMIDNLNELQMFYDYVLYYGVELEMGATYDCIDDLKTINPTFRLNGKTSLGVSETKVGGEVVARKIYSKIITSYRDIEATVVAEDNGFYALNSIGYSENGRQQDFDDFYIYNFPVGDNVETSNQLLYSVEHGFNPNIVENSSAERVFNEAKKVLNKIISPTYDDYEKVIAVYEWLCTNVKYDYEVVKAEGGDWAKYDAYFMEGVFFSHKAVCDGIAKAFSLMCNMEGIPCVEVGGNGHAWNRVKINNKWYVCDATHGNLATSGNYSVLDHSQLFISDKIKTEMGYTSKDYSSIIATGGEYDFYENRTVEILDGLFSTKTINFVVKDDTDFIDVIKYCQEQEGLNLKGNCIDFKFESNQSFSEIVASARRKYLFIPDFTYVFGDSKKTSVIIIF